LKKLVLTLSTILLFLTACEFSPNKIQTQENALPDSLEIENADSVAPSKKQPPTLKSKKQVAKKNQLTSTKTDQYRLRKYNNVTQFYRRLAKPATDLCMDNNVPPAALLAIAGLESGWNQGYVGRITGNILSLGTRGGDTELPALKLPRLKSTGKILFDSLEIIKYQPNELVWEERPPSLKKDYRPKSIAGTTYQLAYFKYRPEEKAQAQLANMNDFVTVFISRKSRIKAYRRGRFLMDSLVAVHGKQILLEDTVAIKFVNEIGGKPNSYNFRTTWPVKVENIIRKAGLEELTKDLYVTNKTFNEVW
jgi:hypothetical protein